MIQDKGKEGYTIAEFDIYYLPHPKLYGNWEIVKGEEFVGRAATKKEVKLKIGDYERNN